MSTEQGPEGAPVGRCAADTLTAHGVFKGARGLEGLLNADAFWQQQPYGTRLYYGDGVLLSTCTAMRYAPRCRH